MAEDQRGSKPRNIFDFFSNTLRTGDRYDVSSTTATTPSKTLPKIIRTTADTGREVNVIEAKVTRSQAKKTVVSTAATVIGKSIPEESSTSPLLQKRMKFNFNVTPSKGKAFPFAISESSDVNNKAVQSHKIGGGSSSSVSAAATSCTCEVKENREPKSLFGSSKSKASAFNNNTITRRKADGPTNFAVNFNLALNMNEAMAEPDKPMTGGDMTGKSSGHELPESHSLDDVYSDPMTIDSSSEVGVLNRGSLSMPDQASSLKVAVRMRPLSETEVAAQGGNRKVIDVWMKDEQVLVPHRKEYFKFDCCLNSTDRDLFNFADQETVYRKMGEPLLEYALRGYNACLFAYGQSGSGKTYTMMGSENVPGVIPRFINELFKRVGSSPSTSSASATEYLVNVSFLEIYNEKIHDLLSDEFDAYNKVLRVREHPETGPFVEDLTVFTVESNEAALELLATGNSRRATASTAANEKSSRSHTIFTILLVQNRKLDGFETEEASTMSKIHLVDLAGSERASAVSAAKDRQREGTCINKSLLTLGKVITQLAENSNTSAHVPYRESALTYLLKDSLGGNSRTSMIATISPAKVHLEETVSTLRYASTASKIVNNIHVNEDPKMKIINGLLKQISFLRREVDAAHNNRSSTDSVEQELANLEKEVAADDAYSAEADAPSAWLHSPPVVVACSGLCTERIAEKLDALDGKFNQLLRDQKTFLDSLEEFMSTEASSSSASNSNMEDDPLPQITSTTSSSKVLDELMSLLAKVEGDDVLRDTIDYAALMKSMEMSEDETEPEKAKEVVEVVEATITSTTNAWTTKAASNNTAPEKPMNVRERKAADAAEKRKLEAEKKKAEEEELAKKRQEAKEAREAKKKAEEEAKKKQEAKEAKDAKEKKEMEAKKEQETKEKEEAEIAQKKAAEEAEKEANKKVETEKEEEVVVTAADDDGEDKDDDYFTPMKTKKLNKKEQKKLDEQIRLKNIEEAKQKKAEEEAAAAKAEAEKAEKEKDAKKKEKDSDVEDGDEDGDEEEEEVEKATTSGDKKNKKLSKKDEKRLKKEEKRLNKNKKKKKNDDDDDDDDAGGGGDEPDMLKLGQKAKDDDEDDDGFKKAKSGKKGKGRK